MKPNLAAAVEHLSEFGIDEALLGLRHLLSELPDHDFRLERHGLESGIKALLVMSNRLAELGRGAGEPVAEVVKPPNGFGVKFMDGFENLPSGTKLYTRPPVAGLAELTDAGLFALFDVMDIAWVCATSPAEGRKDVAKAAREFLGKVDG